MEERKISTREDVQKRVEDRLREISTAQSGEALPTGNVMEEKMIEAEKPVEPVTEPTPTEPVQPEVKEPKRRAGRPRGSHKVKTVKKEKKPNGETSETVTEVLHDEPPIEKNDIARTLINGAILPMAGFFMKKDLSHLQITEDQSKDTMKYMPEDVIMKPSWGAYIGMSLLAIGANAMSAPIKPSKEVEEMEVLKKALAKSIEVETLKVEFLKMQKQLATLINQVTEMHGNMRVVKPEHQSNFTEPVVINQ